MKLLLILGALALAACQDKPPEATAAPIGATSAPPGGWVAYCGRHPADPSC